MKMPQTMKWNGKNWHPAVWVQAKTGGWIVLAEQGTGKARAVPCIVAHIDYAPDRRNYPKPIREFRQVTYGPYTDVLRQYNEDVLSRKGEAWLRGAMVLWSKQL